MYIDTNQEPSNYQDDHYVDTKPAYCRYKEELDELRKLRRFSIQCGTWTWALEEDARLERSHLLSRIQESSGVH